jgi:hypothetical protein
MEIFSLRVFERAEIALEDTVGSSGGVVTDMSDFAGEGWSIEGSRHCPKNAL